MALKSNFYRGESWKFFSQKLTRFVITNTIVYARPVLEDRAAQFVPLVEKSRAVPGLFNVGTIRS
jgi:hypothetical protein